jgi:hypothetical protein
MAAFHFISDFSTSWQRRKWQKAISHLRLVDIDVQD